MTTDTRLSESERDLLKWLSQEDFSQYGECHGKSLDALVAAGFAQIHESDHRGGFIAQGHNVIGKAALMYRAVSLTDRGRLALEEQ